MIDIKLIRENPIFVKENIKKKYKDNKIHLVDDFIEADNKFRQLKQEADNLRNLKNENSEKIGELIRNNKNSEVEVIKTEVNKINDKISSIEVEEKDWETSRTVIWKQIPNIIDDSVPKGKDETENVEKAVHGEIIKKTFEIPYHVEIMENFNGIDFDAAGKVSGNGFYYLIGKMAELHSAILSYAKDFMIKKGFTYVVPPFMMRGYAVEGVMSFEEMDNMMYKVETEDLYLIGTSEHTMIARFLGKTINNVPLCLTSYSPCFRKEKGAHGLEERGVYRIHQFEKQEMIVICDPKDSKEWFEKMVGYTVEFFTSLDIPVRELECCSGDLADLKSKSVDVEAWSPRQQKYFEVGSCSNLTDAQARRLNIKMENGEHPHTLNNTVVASPRALIALLENNLNEDGSVTIPEVLRPYMGGLEKIQPTSKN